MNELTTFFYLASVIPSIGNALEVIVILMTIMCALMWVAHFCTLDDYESDERANAAIRQPRRVFTALIPIILVFWVLIPDQNTMYKMGASIVAGHIVQMEEVQELGGEIGGLATDTIRTLRQHIQSTIPEVE